jgi:hypothetical protein
MRGHNNQIHRLFHGVVGYIFGRLTGDHLAGQRDVIILQALDQLIQVIFGSLFMSRLQCFGFIFPENIVAAGNGSITRKNMIALMPNRFTMASR